MRSFMFLLRRGAVLESLGSQAGPSAPVRFGSSHRVFWMCLRDIYQDRALRAGVPVPMVGWPSLTIAAMSRACYWVTRYWCFGWPGNLRPFGSFPGTVGPSSDHMGGHLPVVVASHRQSNPLGLARPVTSAIGAPGPDLCHDDRSVCRCPVVALLSSQIPPCLVSAAGDRAYSGPVGA